MAIKKRRSDIAKLVSLARKVWTQSENYQTIKKESRSSLKIGWHNCAGCKDLREVIRIDHIKPVGKQPADLHGFGAWLTALFCPIENLQALCQDCHRRKTKDDNKKTRAA